MSEQLYWLRDDNGNWQKVPKIVYDAEMQIRANYKDPNCNGISFNKEIKLMAQTVAAPITVPLAIFRWIAKL
jgi:hypothetical protein